MKHLGNIILTVIVTFFLSIILNAFVSSLMHEKGEIIGDITLELNGRKYDSFTLENFSKQTIEGLVISSMAKSH